MKSFHPDWIPNSQIMTVLSNFVRFALPSVLIMDRYEKVIAGLSHDNIIKSVRMLYLTIILLSRFVCYT